MRACQIFTPQTLSTEAQGHFFFLFFFLFFFYALELGVGKSPTRALRALQGKFVCKAEFLQGQLSEPLRTFAAMHETGFCFSFPWKLFMESACAAP